MTATELAARIRRRAVSVTEVLDAHLDQISRVNPTVNAIVTLLADRARTDARAKDAALARGEAAGPLYGLPIVHKDLVPTRGIRTTYGSPIFRDHVPDADGLIVERLRAAGAVTLGKSNTPEFGAGSQTFNEVFGRTLNPYDRKLTVGGSSGGDAAAVATGMVPLGIGTDMGGSLRVPAQCCGIATLKPTTGRIAHASSLDPEDHGVAGQAMLALGPLARDVSDLRLALSVLAGRDPRDPRSVDAPLQGREPLLHRAALVTELPGAPLGGATLTAMPNPSTTTAGKKVVQ